MTDEELHALIHRHCPVGEVLQTTHLQAALKEAMAASWDEGARFAWDRSGEGWNGEWPPDQPERPWGDEFTDPNPYR